MEINQLMRVLQHGRSYTHTDAEGLEHTVLEAPNKYMIKAARVITGLVKRLDEVSATGMLAQQKMTEFASELEALRATFKTPEITTPEDKPE
jgi:hypothetical protein